ncbi:MAG: hypothetical protein JNM06_12685, partial [Blastocatellia bacterium]|nr:hypothetical protein [Blastocatellia bacterium]
NRLDRKTGSIKVYRKKLGDLSSLALDSVWAIYEDRQGELWIGTYGVGGYSDKKAE